MWDDGWKTSNSGWDQKWIIRFPSVKKNTVMVRNQYRRLKQMGRYSTNIISHEQNFSDLHCNSELKLEASSIYSLSRVDDVIIAVNSYVSVIPGAIPGSMAPR